MAFHVLDNTGIPRIGVKLSADGGRECPKGINVIAVGETYGQEALLFTSSATPQGSNSDRFNPFGVD